MPIIYYFIVETAGKSLEQIDRWFAANPGWLVHKAGDTAFMNGDTTLGGYGQVPTAGGERELMVKDYEQHGRTYDEDMRPIGDDEIFGSEDGEQRDDKGGEGAS